MMKTRIITAIFMMVGLNVIAQIPNYVPTNGLVGWWPFNGNANDESGNNDHGIVINCTLTQDRFGATNSAFSFNNGVIELNNTNYAEYSLHTWLKYVNVGPDTSIFFSKEDSYCNYLTSLPDSPQNTGYWAEVSNASSSGGFLVENSLDTSYHHIVVTYDQLSTKFYFDGVLAEQSSFIQGPLRTTDTNKFVGARFGGGTIDEVGMWNRALTEEEVQNLYNANICFDHVTVTDTLIINFNMTGFNPVTYEHSIEIYPNPTSDHITINYGDFIGLNGYSLSIFNPMGQLVHTSNITQQQEYLDLNTWGGVGVYNVVIYNPQGGIVSTKQIVLQ
jgi:hypothetical protein